MIYKKGPLHADFTSISRTAVCHGNVPNLDGTAAGDNDNGRKPLLPSRFLNLELLEQLGRKGVRQGKPKKGLNRELRVFKPARKKRDWVWGTKKRV